MPEELFLEKPLAIVGQEDAVLGFSALGFKAYPVKDVREFKIALDEISPTAHREAETAKAHRG